MILSYWSSFGGPLLLHAYTQYPCKAREVVDVQLEHADPHEKLVLHLQQTQETQDVDSVFWGIPGNNL